MTQAQPVPPRRSSLGRAERTALRAAQARSVSVLGGRHQHQPAEQAQRTQRHELPARSRSRGLPWLPFALGIACGYGLAGPLPHLVGHTLAGIVRAPQERLAAIVNPFAMGQRRVLVMGTDRVSDNTDVMFTVQVKDGATQLLQVPRDTFVESEQLGVLKANALYAFGGVDAVKDEVGRLLNTPVDRYVRVNLRAVERLADALGGVEVDVPKRMYYVDNAQGLYIDLYPGPQVLKGEALEGFLRFRHDEMGDLGRMERQKLVLAQVFRKLIQPSMLGELPGLLKIAGDDVQTDLSPIEMGQLLSSMANTTLSSSQVPGRLYWHNELSYWMPESNPHFAASEVDEAAVSSAP
ncbi:MULTISPECIES: LCP family protein [Aphanothece]|uniref:LCP family protein n=1 Tax=Aphanothece TaxID=1121 RepID=UPI003985405C